MLDQAFGFKLAKRFPNGRPADRKLFGQCFLAQSRTGDQLSGHDAISDRIRELLHEVDAICCQGPLPRLS